MNILKQFPLLLIFFSIGEFIGQMTLVNNFGTNPGNLTMYEYVPSNVQPDAGVVLVMHGCGQLANDFANETGWNDLADQYGFYVIHAGQSLINNGNKCFNWFSPFDYGRDLGEAFSLAQMVDYMHANYTTNEDRTYVCGLSAGGCMTSVMMAVYPDKFHKGGIWAGSPYRYSATNGNSTPQQWGDYVRNAYSYNGTYPKLFICQGTSDAIVDPVNEERLVDQWTNVHGVDQTADVTTPAFQGNSDVTQKLYQDNAGTDTIVVTYTVNNMGHGVAVDPGTGTMQGGETSLGAFDVNFFSTYWMADFFDLITTPVSISETNNSVDGVNFKVSNGQLSVNTNTSISKSLSIYSFSGQLINSQNFNQDFEFDTSALNSSANYIVVVRSSLGQKVASFIFNK